jgi:magnesium-transporting ATPase (P-type)
MDQSEVSQQNKSYSFSDYMPSVGIVGAIFSLISFVGGLFFGYQQINAEPTGSFFSPFMISSGVICLITSVAGLVAVWHFTREVSPQLKLGQGAVIGFLTGAVIVVISIVFSELWVMLIDPDYNEKILESMIANIEAMDMPQSSKDDMIDAMAESIDTQQTILRQIFWGVPITGLLNLLTALIGVKLFAEKEEETF